MSSTGIPTALCIGCHVVPHNMPTDTTVPSGGGTIGPDVMAAVDDEGRESRFVIADISQDEAWVSMPADAATPLTSWR